MENNLTIRTTETNLKEMSKDQLKIVYNAINNPTYRVGDMINQVIDMAMVHIAPIEVSDSETGEMIMLPKTVIIDTQGESYSCVSKGIYNALNNIIDIFGEPSPENVISVKVVQKTGGKFNKFLTLEIA